MKYKIIANPMAGKGNARLLIPKVVRRLKEYDLDFDIVETQRPWQAADLAHEAAAQGYDAVVAAGGDGTFNEVLNGLMLARQNGPGAPALGMICIGRGNDFAYGAGIPTHWEEGCQVLARNTRRAIDIGRISGDCLHANGMDGARYFGNGIGIGFDAVLNIEATKTKLGGLPGYTVAALRTILLHFKAPLMLIECDEATITQPTLMISIMNGQRMGGGFHMTPESAINDGVLDLCIAHQVNRLTILMMIPRFMKGTQAGHPAVRFERCSRVVVTALSDELPFHVDGESICADAHQLTIEILPSALEVIG